MLYEFLSANRERILTRTRARVASRKLPVPTEEELKNGVPLFLEQLIDRLRSITNDSDAIEETATRHGGELLDMGFSVSQVVHGYGDICQVITALAVETDAPITTDEFQMFNKCLDDAMAHAVTEFVRQRDLSVAHDGRERLGVLVHEIRNRLSAATLAYAVLKDGTVAIGGSTGAVLGRNLRALRVLVDNAIVGVRIESGLGHRERFSVSALATEALNEAALGGAAGGFGVSITDAADGAEVAVDQQIILAALGNLLQNAFKFSRAGGQISMRTSATAESVLIEVEDECGGLPAGNQDEMFEPFSQRSGKRVGLGLGLPISRRGVSAMGGKLSVRDIPGKGCVFSIELPRLPRA